MKNRTIEMKAERNPRFLFPIAPFLAAAFLYLRTFLLPATPFVAFGDEVHYFLHAVRMLHGQLPYRDFFTFVFPGTDLLYVLVFRIFGVHQWVAQGLIVLLGLLLACVVTWVSSSVLRGRRVLLPALLLLAFDFTGALDATHHWWSTLSVLAATGILLGGIDRRRVVAAGALCGVATLFTQTEGVLSLFALATYVVMMRRQDEERSSALRGITLLVAPFVVVVGGVIGYFAWQVGLRTIFYWTIYFPLTYFSTIPAHTPGAYFLRMPAMHGLGNLFSALPYLLIHLIVPLSYVLCFVRLIRRKREMEPLMWERIFLITLVGFAVFLSVANAATFLRLCVIAPPALILTVWYFDGNSKAERWVRSGLWTAGIVFLISLSISRQVHARNYLDLPTGRAAFTVPTQYDRVQWLAARTHPGETFFNDPYVAFALSLNSPGPIDYVVPSEFTRPEQVNALLQSMTALQTRFVFFYPEMNEPSRSGDNLGPLREYVAQNYHLAKADFTGQMWERN
jgi:4-amino-4-deoxy-L-arabinose transferase-like glycosyltransferase